MLAIFLSIHLLSVGVAANGNEIVVGNDIPGRIYPCDIELFYGPAPLGNSDPIPERRTLKRPSIDDRLNSGDVVSIYGLPGKRKKKPGFYIPQDSMLAPTYGEMFVVLPDGDILLPSAGSVAARGRTLEELQTAIEARLTERGLLKPRKFVLVQLAYRHGGP